MFTRLTYISKYDEEKLSQQEINSIVEISVRNNSKIGVTGFLTAVKGVFFQTIEGEHNTIDALFNKISKDPRHYDTKILKMEKVNDKLFPQWSMQQVNLNDNTSENLIATPIKALLSTLTDSHTILERYTQPTVLTYLSKGIDPLQIPVKRTDKVIMFADIMSFTTFSEKLPAEAVAALLDVYLEIVTSIIRKHNGEVSKYIADCCLAYFEASELGATSAVKASLEILTALQQLRLNPPKMPNDLAGQGVNPLSKLYCGIGISMGSCVEGNIGSNTKKDYTLIGDAVNISARLEAHTRNTAYFMVFDGNVHEKLVDFQNVTKLENVVLKGKLEPVEVYTIDDSVNIKPRNLNLKHSISAFLNLKEMATAQQRAKESQKAPQVQQTKQPAKKKQSLFSLFSCTSNADVMSPR